jgi:hypothetical protein
MTPSNEEVLRILDKLSKSVDGSPMPKTTLALVDALRARVIRRMENDAIDEMWLDKEMVDFLKNRL